MIWLTTLGLALGSEAPPEGEVPEDAHSGFGLGVAWLGAPAPASSQRVGLHLDLRSESRIAGLVRFHLVLGAGVTSPQNTVAMFGWGTGAGRSITGAFGSVHDWAARGSDAEAALRQTAALMAYLGLGISYLAVPVVWILSPVASVGHLVLGPTVSVRTSRGTPDAYVEAGVGAHVGGQAVGLRLLVSPPGAHAVTTGSDRDPVLSGAFVVTL